VCERERVRPSEYVPARTLVWVDEVCFDVCPHARYSRTFDAVVSEFETRETLPQPG